MALYRRLISSGIDISSQLLKSFKNQKYSNNFDTKRRKKRDRFLFLEVLFLEHGGQTYLVCLFSHGHLMLNRESRRGGRYSYRVTRTAAGASRVGADARRYHFAPAQTTAISNTAHTSL